MRAGALHSQMTGASSRSFRCGQLGSYGLARDPVVRYGCPEASDRPPCGTDGRKLGAAPRIDLNGTAPRIRERAVGDERPESALRSRLDAAWGLKPRPSGSSHLYIGWACCKMADMLASFRPTRETDKSLIGLSGVLSILRSLLNAFECIAFYKTDILQQFNQTGICLSSRLHQKEGVLE